jgi:hypothetical protein
LGWKHGSSCRATVTKIDIQIQRKRIENLEINPHSYSLLIFDKGDKNRCWRKDIIFHKWCWKKLLSIYRRLKLDPYLSRYIKINSKWIKDLNIRFETMGKHWKIWA